MRKNISEPQRRLYIVRAPGSSEVSFTSYRPNDVDCIIFYLGHCSVCLSVCLSVFRFMFYIYLSGE